METTNALADLRSRLRNVAHRLGLPAFWRWWWGEFAPLVPSAPRAALQRRRVRPVLAFGDHAVVLWRPQVANGVLSLAETARVALPGDAAATRDAGRAMVEALTVRVYGGTQAANVVVALPPQQVLRKQLTLPAAVEENLKQALAYDLDRHTPFRPEQLRFDAVVVARDVAKKEIRVDWAAALKTNVEQAKQLAESWGATVVAVTPDAPDSSASTLQTRSKLNLLPLGERPDLALWRRWQLWAPLGLTAAIAIAAIVVPIWQKRDFAIALNQLADQVGVQAAASDALRTQLEQQIGDYNFVLGKKYAFPSSTQVLEDVTKLLPDDTWLTQLELKTTAKAKDAQREMLLRGESANAGRLISLLEESKLFEQAAPRSPTTKIQPGPGELFDLGARLIASPAPALVPLTPVDAAAGAADAKAVEVVAPAMPVKPDAAVAAPAAADSSQAPAGTQSPMPAPAGQVQVPAAAPAAITSNAAPAIAPATAPAAAPTAAPATPVAMPSASEGTSPASEAPRPGRANRPPPPPEAVFGPAPPPKPPAPAGGVPRP